MPEPEPEPAEPADYRDRCEALTGESLRRCPACGRGRMVGVEAIPPGGEAPDPEDTS